MKNGRTFASCPLPILLLSPCPFLHSLYSNIARWRSRRRSTLFPRPVSPHCVAVTIAVPRVRPALVCTTRTTHLHPRRDTVAVCVRGRRALRVPAQCTWAHRTHLPIPILPLFPLPFPPRSHHTPPRCIAVAATVPCVRPALVYTAAQHTRADSSALGTIYLVPSVRIHTRTPRGRRVRGDFTAAHSSSSRAHTYLRNYAPGVACVHVRALHTNTVRVQMPLPRLRCAHQAPVLTHTCAGTKLAQSAQYTPYQRCRSFPCLSTHTLFPPDPLPSPPSPYPHPYAAPPIVVPTYLNTIYILRQIMNPRQ
ncbi:hypothetical protein B0H16DRAFT_1739260 [Mycena metata]|uniref:Uncharacterized protein n=1 Tax=Mycena metata TaxID=1033252 RepID=A0AAD7MJJ6_9AGAR|nr:hypothetical protein B0H16DRAFT_1739260 [Mycena metata]